MDDGGTCVVCRPSPVVHRHFHPWWRALRAHGDRRPTPKVDVATANAT